MIDGLECGNYCGNYIYGKREKTSPVALLDGVHFPARWTEDDS
jgi:hypothetical protein